MRAEWMKLMCTVCGIGLLGSPAQAEDTPADTLAPITQETSSLAINASTSYVSKYIWRGYDLFDDHAALQPSVTMDLFQTGFGVNVWGSIPMGTGSNHDSGGINSLQEYDYTLSYGTTLFEEEKYAVALGANYIYYDLIKLNHMADTQELGMSVSLPNLLIIGENALIPRYYYGQLWPTSSGCPDVAGAYHSLGLSYDLAIPNTKQRLTFASDMNYNDGLFTSDHDWSHATLGVSTGFEVSAFTITPFLNYQVSMDDSVNPDDELFGGVTVSVSF